MTMTAGASPLHDLIALAREPSSARRRELLRRVTDLFLAGSQAADASEMAAFDSVMGTLTAWMPVDARVELASRFADATGAPNGLAAALARDCIEVAMPILSNAHLLEEADLLDVARSQGQEHLRVVSARPGLSEAVSDVIVDRGDDETLGVLIRNDSAALSRQANEAVVDRATRNPSLHLAVLDRAGLPLDLLNEMFFVVERELRGRILAKNAAADPAKVEAALATARKRMQSRLTAEIEGLPEAEADVAKAAERNRLNPTALIAYMRAGQRAHFVAGLARLCEVEPATVQRVVQRRDVELLAILCRAIDIERAMFLTFAVMVLDSRDAMQQAPALGRLYADVPQDVALRTLRFWRVRCEVEDLAA
jgi:uncharacterized protein (DUF2336 family)